MNAQVLWHCPYPWDIRIEKVVNVLLGMDLGVSLVSKGRPDLSAEEVDGSVRIRRVGGASDLLGKAASYPLFFNPMWWNAASRAIRDDRPSCLIVRDLPLGRLAVRLGRKFDIPVVLDMAENYPAALVAYQKAIYQPFLLGNAALPRAYERAVVRSVDHVLVVARENVDRLGALGVPASKITVVRNTPDPQFVARAAEPAASAAPDGAAPEILYVGKIDRHRGVDLMVRAMPAIRAAIPGARMVLVGDGLERENLMQLAADMGLGDSVTFPGWVTHDRLPHHIRAATVCCIPHLKSEHTDTTIPNKLFDYMAFSKPVVSSNLEPVQRIIERVGCGHLFPSGDAAALADAVIRCSRTSAAEALGKRGRQAVVEEYNWDVDARRLADCLEPLLGRSESGA